MLQLIRHIDRHDLACEIVLVAANHDCVGLAEAAKRNLPTACLDRAAFYDRAAQETVLGNHIEAAGADWICLAGYTAVLSAAFVTRFAGRIINIHPSLLPAHKGLHTHQRALDAGDTRHGASVHIVTPALDDGPLRRYFEIKVSLTNIVVCNNNVTQNIIIMSRKTVHCHLL